MTNMPTPLMMRKRISRTLIHKRNGTTIVLRELLLSKKTSRYGVGTITLKVGVVGLG